MIKYLKNLNQFCSIREQMNYDVLIMGGGPGGLATSIRLAQLAQKNNKPLSICLLEKGSYIGAHILSGNVFQPNYLHELFPDLQNHPSPPPLTQPVTQDQFVFLTEKKSYQIPNVLLPSSLHNANNYIISLGDLCNWFSKEAEQLGVEIYTGMSGSEIIYKDGKVVGVRTGDQGIKKDGTKGDAYTQGVDIYAKQIVLAEGCRGSLSEEVINKYNLREDKAPQSYGLGIKEVWQVQPDKFVPGLVKHGFGWPLDNQTYGGFFLYHAQDNLVYIGMIVGLDYKNPYINPYEELQRVKTHPSISSLLKDGKCVSYGARTLNEGSYFSIPKLTFPGGMLVGCSAGFLSITKIKGSHNAMKSGMVAAEEIFKNIDQKEEITSFEEEMKKGEVFKELYQERNVKKAFKRSMFSGIVYSGLAGHIFKGREPWNFVNKVKDSESTQKKDNFKPIEYPKHDNKLTFDLLTNLQKSGTDHNPDQPAHLKIKKQLQNIPLKSLNEYDGPEQRFCPAKVYEFVQNEAGQPQLQINAQNCLHCKACSIKMVDEYIQWTVPEGGGGPNYNGM